jgi:hypothetical protein
VRHELQRAQLVVELAGRGGAARDLRAGTRSESGAFFWARLSVERGGATVEFVERGGAAVTVPASPIPLCVNR